MDDGRIQAVRDQRQAVNSELEAVS
jgi:hypothetical protein